MKKIFKLLLFFVGIAIVCAILAAIKPYMSRTCNLDDFGITLKVPNAYEVVESEHTRSILSLYNSQKGIRISALDMGKNFWGYENVTERMEEYLKVISAANYDATVQNIKREVIELSGISVGRVEIEVVKPTKKLKTISLIMGADYGSVVIEIYGETENMNLYQAEIEELIKMIRFGKNKHVYEEIFIENNSGEISGEKIKKVIDNDK